MKRFSLAASGLLLGALFLVQAPAQAAGVHSLELNLRYYAFDYKEDVDYPFKSTERGAIPDLEVNYYFEGDADTPFYGRIIFDYGVARTDYDGSTQSGKPVKTDTDNVFSAAEINLGYTFTSSLNPLALAVYTGAGQRYWERDLQGIGGYAEDYTLRYVPVGVRAFFPNTERWKGALDISALIIFNGEMQGHLARIGLDDKTYHLGKSVGWKFELPLAYQYTDHWALTIRPWYEVFNIVKSDWVTATHNGQIVHNPDGSNEQWREPSSLTERFGMNLGARYSF